MTGEDRSGPTLVQLLGLRPGQKVSYVNPPEHFEELVGELPEGVRVHSELDGPLDMVVCFVTERRVFQQRLKRLHGAVAPDGMLWVAWPSPASDMPTTVSEDVVRDVALPAGFVGTEVCAIDETWSALRLVVGEEPR